MLPWVVSTHCARRPEFLASLLVWYCTLAQPATPTTVPVSDLLRALIGTGVDILYSSELVPPTLVVTTPSPTADPMTRVLEGLAASDLQLKRIDDRHYVVTRAAMSQQSKQNAEAQSPAGTEALDEVLVFASHYTFRNEAAGEPKVLDKRGIEQVAGTQNDALRALRAAPGVATTYSSRPYLRGSNADDVLVRFDGIALTNPYHFREFQSLISPFIPAAVERIDMYSGGFPVRFGTRLAGVIDVAPRVVASGYEVRADGSQLGGDLAAVGRIDRWPVEWLTTVRRSTEGTNVLNPVDAKASEPTFFDALARVRWQLGATSSATLGWLLFKDRALANAHDANQSAEARTRDEYLWLAWAWAPDRTLQSHTSMAYTRSGNEHSGRLQLTGIADGSVAEARDFRIFALRTEWTYVPSAAVVWSMGGEISTEHAELNYTQRKSVANLLVPAVTQRAATSFSSSQAPQASTWALFASARRQWHSLEAELGVRMDSQIYQNFGVRTQLTPRLNMRYDAASDWHVYASSGMFSQAQRVDEYRSEEDQSSPDSASRARHTLVGLSHDAAHDLHWRAELYRHHWSSVSPYYDNALGLVTLLPELQPDRIRIAPTSAQSDGIELSARQLFGDHLELWGSYSLARAFDELTGQSVPRSWDQRQAANFGVAWAGSRTRASMLLSWHSGWPRTGLSVLASTPTSPASLVLGERNALRWGDYFSADMYLSHTLLESFGELSLWLDASNATGRSNDCCADLSAVVPPATMPEWSTDAWSGRHVNIGFTWLLEKIH